MNYTQYFETKKRIDGKQIKCLKENAPIELVHLIREIHTNCFWDCAPNDWIYSTIYEAFQDLKADEIDDIHIEAEPYNDQLATWFYENCNAYANELSQEVADEMDMKGCSAIDLISCAQHEGITRIYQAVNDFLKEREAKE